MLNLSNLIISFSESFGDVMVVAEPDLSYRYENQKKTEEIEAIRYTVISTRTWDKLSVKVNEQVPSVHFNGKPVPVIFKNPKVKLWRDFHSNEIKTSITAESIEEIASHTRLKMNKGDA